MPATEHHPDPAAGVDITVRVATGSGSTPLSAFDTALLAAGVANFNLIPLSSVIPPGSTVRCTTEPLTGTHGDRLYCVMASAQTVVPGEEVWAGIGWVVDPETDKGLFVEHHAATEETLRDLIGASLGDMARNRGGGYGEVRMALSRAVCEEQPVCALVLAAYQVQGWELPGGDDV